jgi:carbamoyltransferase
MTISFKVKEEFINLFPGIVHVDGTCRVQTVSQGHLYDLLKEFKKRTGLGVLLNTSFNLAGDPLVETVADAINTLNNSFLDYVWFVDKNNIVT